MSYINGHLFKRYTATKIDFVENRFWVKISIFEFGQILKFPVKEKREFSRKNSFKKN